MKFAESLKAYMALAGSVLTALSATPGLLPEKVQPYVALALAVVTAVTTWAVPNKPPAAPSSNP